MDPTIERAQIGDADALGSLVREHYARVYRFCVRRLGENHGPDAAQETFVTMHRQIRRYRGDGAFGTWLLGIAHNHCRATARRRRLEPVPLLDSCGADDPGAQAVIDRQALRQALNRLSPEHRDVVLLHEVEELTYAEIAVVLGVPEGTVKSRLHHAFRNLRECLQGGSG